jgi:hypothetical protein
MSAISTPHMCKFDRIVKAKYKMGRYRLDEEVGFYIRKLKHGFKLAITNILAKKKKVGVLIS